MANALSAEVGRHLRQRGWTLAVAESCTGGLLGHLITATPGSSDYFLGGVIAYANEVKQNLLGVRAETLQTHGAVSRETAIEMARGVRDLLHADVALAITGIAGPGGGTAEKPVGLVYIAIALPEGESCERHVWPGDREENKYRSANAALELLLRHL